MSAPLKAARRFFKGLFGKDGSGQTEHVRDDATYDYYQSAPVTGAQIKSPAAVQPSPLRAKVQTPHAAPAPAVSARIVPTRPANGTIPIQGVAVATAPAPVPVAARIVPASQPAAPQAASAPASGKFVGFPLAKIVAVLPPELQERIMRKNFGDFMVSISFELVMSQLSTGVIRIPFGLLRENAPQFFAPAGDADQTMIALPLGEVLKQITPAQFSRPANQVRLAPGEEVEGPFGDKGGNNHLEVKSDAPQRQIAPEVHSAPAAPARQHITEVPKPAAPAAPSPAPVRIQLPPTPAAPAAPAQSPAPVQARVPQPPSPAIQPVTPPSAPASKPAEAGVFALPPTKISGSPTLRMVGSSGTPEPEQAATPPPPPEQQPHLSVPLKSLVESWPEAIQNEVLQQQLLNAKVALPALTVSEQLKHGRVCFTWDVLRSWMSPKPAASTEYGERTLELPLKVVAPLFLGIKNGEPKSQRLVADQQIPDVFAPVAKPAAAAAPVASPAPATVAKAEPAPIVPPLEKTPEALVARAAALKGVAGALIALPDGLVVASRLPAGLNGENLAAFLPQVYSKFDAGLRALNMGALGDLNFTAGGVPWRVFRTHKLFFAVFGRGTEPLPGESLTALAKELE